VAEASGRVRYLSDEEEAELHKKLPAEADRDRLRVLVQTGLRKAEFLGLRWRDVDFKGGVLTIPRSKNGETRHVPMTSAVRGILAHLPRPLDSSGLVFPNTVGGVDLRWAEKTFPEPSVPPRSKISGSTTLVIMPSPGLCRATSSIESKPLLNAPQ
jgi:integrase